MSKAKRNALLLLTVAGVLTLVLAMSLPHMALAPGQPFSLEEPESDTLGASGLFLGGDALIWVFRGMLALALILLPVYVVYSLLTAEGRRRLIANVVLIALLFLLADYLQNHPFSLDEQEAQEQAVSSPDDAMASSGLPATVFTPNPPIWLTPVIILVASAIGLVILLAVLRYFRQRAEPADFVLEKLAEAAQNTIVSLQAGGDFEVTVVRCYQEMSRVVEAEKGIARESAMTPREFEDRLIGKGLPQDAIRTLTRLFERVRYGSLPSGTREVDTALACLTDIVKACGGQHEAR